MSLWIILIFFFVLCIFLKFSNIKMYYPYNYKEKQYIVFLKNEETKRRTFIFGNRADKVP